MKINEIVEELVRATQAGRIRWQQTDNPNSYIYALKSGAFRIERKPLMGTVGLTVYDAQQHQIHAVETGSHDPVGVAIQTLISAAERSAAASTQALDNLLGELRRLPPAAGM